jgi:Icc protein
MHYIALISDLHILESGHALNGVPTDQQTRRLVSQLASETVPLAAIVCLGDLADTAENPVRSAAVATSDSYRHAQALLEPLHAPLHIIPGNHDAPELLAQYFPPHWHMHSDGVSTLRVGSYTLIALDLRTGPEPTGFIPSDMVARCNEVLASTDRSIILSHYPLVTLDNPRIAGSLSVTNQELFTPLLRRNRGKIIACFHGHLHLSVTARSAEALSIGVPSASFMFDLAPASHVKESISSDSCGYLILGLSDDGCLSVWPRWLPNATRSR